MIGKIHLKEDLNEKEFVLNKKNLGSIMKTAKTVENMDMQVLSNMLKEV